MPDSPIVIILAAGLGTRMKSELAKVLHPVAGRPLIVWMVETARHLAAARTVVVLGHQLERVQAVLEDRFGAGAFEVVHQKEQRGTGHAVFTALSALQGEPDERGVVILYGDTPLLRAATVQALLRARDDAPLALVTAEPHDPTGYGRVVRDAAGRIQRIVEHKDGDDRIRAIHEINAGIYSISLGFLRKQIEALSSDNAQGELYLTDLVAQAAARGEVPSVTTEYDEVAGINDRVELARMDRLARLRINESWMRAGVTLLSPESVLVDPDVEDIGRDTVLAAGVQLRGRCRIGSGVTIDVGCVLTECEVDDGAVIKPYSVLAETRVGARAQVGPFTHCRPGTELGDGVKVGNFVETKKARLGEGAKANHLAYLGDADVGAGANVGAGTITCNYDGEKKSKTVIGEGAFIGSDTQLVAPVTVGKGAYVGAGTTVTKDVPAGALAISRTPQRILEGYAERKKK